ncbi:hypothetical protein [Dickeya dianthicola]|uniref:hypothetical protein n=1 Tax=Dickeya dianthicola TaxID=204039 RepID=UPI0018694BDD|nr:hypothetical protein [Dickeya dianthicola]QOL13959.1 hypothetical protein HGI48_06820 [Dickeya dianthicola]
MERRELAKKIFYVVGGSLAGASVLKSQANELKYQSEAQHVDIASLYRSNNSLHDTVNILQFGTMDDASSAFYQALLYINKRGGGNLLVPNGNYIFNRAVKIRIGCKISIYTSSNTIMTMSENEDMFNIIGSEHAAFRIFGNGEFIYSGPKTESASCIRFISLNNGGVYASSSFECNGRLRFRKGKNEWKYALHLTDVRDVVLIGPQFDGLNLPGKMSEQIGVYVQTKNSASVSWVISDLQFNDMNTAFYIESNTVPGAEGFKFFNCDMVGVKCGIFFKNNAKYYPPQIEIVGCHMNGYGSLINVDKVLSIHIVGGLFYRKGGSDGAFLEFDSVQDVSIVGASFCLTGKETDVPCILIKSTDGISGFFRISDCHFWANKRKKPFLKILGEINTLLLSNSSKDSSGKWIDTSEMSSFRDNIHVDTNTISLSEIDKGEIWGGSIDCAMGIVDLRNALPGIVYLKNATALKKIFGGRINSIYVLISDSVLELQYGVNITNGSEVGKGKKKISVIFDGENYTII